MSWNYRIIRTTIEKDDPKDEQLYDYTIHEVYYESDNETIKNVTVNPVAICAVDDVGFYEKVKQALEKPMLTWEEAFKP